MRGARHRQRDGVLPAALEAGARRGAEWDALRRAAHQPRDVVLPPSAVVRRAAHAHPAGAARRASARRPAEFLERRLLDGPGGVLARHGRHGRRRAEGRLHRLGRRHQPPRDRRRAPRPLRPARRRHGSRATIGSGSSARSAREPATEYEIVDELRQRVRFMATNLVEAGGFRLQLRRHLLPQRADLLLARRRDAGGRRCSRRCLTLGGYLLLGPGEAPNDRPPGLEPVTVNGVRAFQRKSARPAEVRA